MEHLKVETVFKLKYHNEELSKSLWDNTIRKHNELVDYLSKRLYRMEKEIEDLKSTDKNKNLGVS